MATPLLEQPVRAQPARRPVVWTFAAVLGVIVAISAIYASDHPATTSVDVYQVDWKNNDDRWQVWAWGSASAPRPASETQAAKRRCRRESATHDCRLTTVAHFSTRQAAGDYVRTACRNYTRTTGATPTAMATCP